MPKIIKKSTLSHKRNQGRILFPEHIQKNAWFTMPADYEILFTHEVGNKWQQSAKLLGIDTNKFSHQAGHA